MNLVAAVVAGQVEAVASDRGIRHASAADPEAFSWARLQASRGAGRVTTLRHEEADLEPDHRVLLPLLDGTRDRAALLAALPGPVPHAEEAWLEAQLASLGRTALLAR